MPPEITRSTDHVFVVGEALTDIVAEHRRTREYPGGSPMNVAYGVARLGTPTTLRTAIGRDERGHAIVQHLESAGVAIDPASFGDHPTSTARAEIDAEGHAEYEFDILWSTGLVEPPAETTVLHTGSIAAVLTPGSDDVRGAFASAPDTVLRTLDPNVRPSITGDRAEVLARIEGLAALAHVVKLSDEDAEFLYPTLSLDAVLDRQLSLGAGLALITRGADGCLAAAPDARVALPSLAVTVVDTIGAGDSFMAGVIHAILSSSLSDLVRRGDLGTASLDAIASTALRCASITVGRAGAQPPTAAELAAVA